MSDGDALLAAIAAHPDDDTPRLVYADWLDEHDDPLRAEFVRVQVAVRRLEERPASEQREHVHLWRRQQELLDNHRRDLLGPVADQLGPFDALFERGFVSELNLSAPAFLAHAAEVAALRPAPRVRVASFGWPSLSALIDSPHAACLEALTVRPTEGDAPDYVHYEGFSALGSAPHFGRLEVLDVSGHDSGDEGLIALAHGTGLPRLAELQLEANEITDAGLTALVTSPLWARLRRINLSLNQLSDASAEMLLAAPESPLEYLNLRMNQIGPAVYPQLLERFGGRIDLF
jgi:uncharacterized protein (TIGR02996 family)